MEIVKTTNFYHREKECIGFFFEKDAKLQGKLQKLLCAKWSATHKCWYCERNDSNLYKIENDLNISVDEEIETKNINIKTAIQPTQKPSAFQLPQKANTETNKKWLSDENKKALADYLQILNLKGYSSSTQRTYVNEFTQFLNLIGKTNAADFSVARIKDYLEYCKVSLKLSENSLHSRMNALKFYYEQVLKREKFFWDIPRPKKPMQLPKLLNEDELRKLFNALVNKKHKAMLFTAYSAGLRVSEVVNLKIANIDSERMQIFIERAKGKKDRYVNLSPILLDILRKYLTDYKPRPKVYPHIY